MRRLLHRGVLSIFCLTLLTGCWDDQEIEMRSIVVSMAIDKKDGGYEVSVQVPNPGQIASGGGGGGGEGGGGGGPGAVEVYSGEGTTLEEAIGELDRKSIYPLFFGHMETLLFSEGVAREGVRPFMDWIRRSPEIRRHMYPIVIDGKAKDALLVQPKLEQIPTYYLRNFIESGITAKKVSDMTLGKVFVDLSHPGKQVPMFYYFKPGKDGFQYKGMAVFRSDKMVGTLNEVELNPVLHFREEIQGYPIVINCPGKKGKLVFEPKQIEKALNVTNKPEASIDIRVKGVVLENECSFTMKDEKAFQNVNQLIAKTYERTAAEVLRKAQKGLKQDVFLIRNRVYAFYPEIWRKMNWEKEFPSMPIHIRYAVEVGRIGLKAL
ncbi:Ger(x)C family spore germination protein [Laceyella putida]|uniref:Ger(X)C family spore germination protein n=1 Tax=Laceyella putida TaxID=110101 RepID=A0ABW2RNL9_9BACL